LFCTFFKTIEKYTRHIKPYTTLKIEAGAPFGGRYLPAVTLYFNGETWQTEAIDIDTKLLGIAFSMGAMASSLTLIGAYMLIKKKED
jgi:hypothetical protein